MFIFLTLSSASFDKFLSRLKSFSWHHWLTLSFPFWLIAHRFSWYLKEKGMESGKCLTLFLMVNQVNPSFRWQISLSFGLSSDGRKGSQLLFHSSRFRSCSSSSWDKGSVFVAVSVFISPGDWDVWHPLIFISSPIIRFSFIWPEESLVHLNGCLWVAQ